MKSFDILQEVIADKFNHIYLIIGDDADFNLAVSQDDAIQYPLCYAFKDVRSRVEHQRGSKARHTTSMDIFLLENPEQLDIPIEQQRMKVHRMVTLGQEIFQQLKQHKYSLQVGLYPFNLQIQTIYYRSSSHLLGCRYTYDHPYYPEFDYCKP